MEQGDSKEPVKAKVYLANQFGFSETGRYVLDNLIKPRITEMGIELLDPFLECGKELNFAELNASPFYDHRVKYWEKFSLKVTPINNGLMQKSDAQAAILDGGHALDDGVSSEIGYYAGIQKGPIFALRSDFRCGENIAVSINPQVLGYVINSSCKVAGVKGKLIDGPNATERWFAAIQGWHEAWKKMKRAEILPKKAKK